MKKVGLIFSLICIFYMLTACTDNGDDTPVEVELETKEQGIVDPENPIDFMLQQI